MLHFLQPIWLFAGAGIIVPVIIHLWNLQSGKTLKVGSIRLMDESQKQNVRSRVLTDIPLLILRCLLILVLAMLLAIPEWKTSTNATDVKGWILVEEKNINTTYSNFKPEIDSLIASGYETRLLDTTFSKIDIKRGFTTSDSATTNTCSRWQLLSMLDQRLPAGFPISVFTDNSLNKFEGSRPGLSLNINWKTFKGADSSSVTLVAVRKTADDSMRLSSIKSSIAGNAAQFLHLAADNAGADEIAALRRENAFSITDSSVLFPDTGSIQIAIYSDRAAIEANYLVAAINAIGNYGKYRINVSIANRPEDLSNAGDWVFWLSDKPAPGLNKAKHIFKYATGDSRSVSSWLVNENGPVSEEAVSVTRYIQAKSQIERYTEIAWQSGFGDPILTKQDGVQDVYEFYSRFDPSWTSLVWDEKFPLWLMKLLLPSTNAGNLGLNDKRVIDQQQLQPRQVASTAKNQTARNKESTDLTKAFWIIAFVLFLAERIISSRNRNRRAVVAAG